MKHVKRFASLMLAVVLVLAMSMPVLAAGNHTLTISSKTSGHTFEAYQVFKGTYYKDQDMLADIQWGGGVDGEALLTELKGENAYASCKTAEDVAKVVKGLTDDSEALDAFAKIVSKHLTTSPSGTSGAETGSEGAYVYEIGGLEDGYYFVKDKDNSLNGSTAAYTKFILRVTDDATVQAKTDTSTAVKKVQENIKYTADGGYGQGYNDVADYTIGEKVPFLFSSTIPDMSNFATYKYIFHDTLSTGLTFNNDVTVKINGTDVKTGYNVNLNPNPTETGFDVVFADLKTVSGAAAGATITIEFTATLNAGAVIGGDGNPNEMVLEYSNNPNDESSTTKTPGDKVVVFTYELDTTKIDGDTKKALEGVQFKLYRGSDNKWAQVDAEGKISGWADSENDATVLKSNADGLFKVIGLDDGEYYLKETQALPGYNTLSQPIKVVISAKTNHIQDWAGEDTTQVLESLKVTYGTTESAGKVENGVVSGTIENNTGTTLPSTGGIGTTIFYIIGGILVAGAAILLIGKKFVGNEK